ncbi:MAG: polysulfide reductase NrfD [bacterium]|nr:MAG: polysulfide reductase NrfD [bacterium]
MVDLIKHFVIAVKQIFTGSRNYYIWIAFLGFWILLGFGTYVMQLKDGLIVTAMRDQVSWGFYLSNFTFLVGVAAAAVLLVIPAYIYDFKPIKEIVLFGELLAITAISMCIMFIMVDIGRPDRVWHIMPFLGTMNFPSSLLAWDVLVLNGYLFLNLTVVAYVMYRIAHNKDYSMAVVRPLVILSIPWAVSIHTVTAFLYNGLPARPFWNASILAPRFLASAFCSGPAIMIILFQIIRKISSLEIEDRALNKIAELIAYAMGFNLFLFGAEVFKEFYSGTVHMAPIQYMYFGLHGHDRLVPWLWMALIFNLIAFFLFLSPRARENPVTLNLACSLVILGVYVEKGMGLVIPGFIPGTLGEIYEYSPTNHEIIITIGVWAVGALLYTLMLKVAIPIYTGKLRFSAGSAVTAQDVSGREVSLSPDQAI